LAHFASQTHRRSYILEIWAAIDLSGKDACFSVGSFPGEKIILSTSFQMRGRDSSGLLPRLEECLKGERLSLGDVKRWTVGTGPGNYTGLRIVSALVSGIAFGKGDTLCRGIPSAYAIAAGMNLAGNEKAAVVYPLEEGRIFSFAVESRDGVFFPVPELSGSFQSTEFTGGNPGIRIAALKKDFSILLEEIRGRAVFFVDLPVANLLFMNPSSWDGNSVRDLIYIRPAVSVAPMSIRSGTAIGDQ
jgi:tRNA threonylcarbamoyladenosine biosynthesis protein TsaB